MLARSKMWVRPRRSPGCTKTPSPQRPLAGSNRSPTPPGSFACGARSPTRAGSRSCLPASISRARAAAPLPRSGAVPPQPNAGHRLPQFAVEVVPPLRACDVVASGVAGDDGLDVRCQHDEVERLPAQVFAEVTPALADDDVVDDRREAGVVERPR